MKFIKLLVPCLITFSLHASVQKIGHRGAWGYEPENTLRSFERAIVACGVDMIELDVQLCKSGELIVIHDKKVDRTTNGTGYVADKTLQELKQLDAGKGEQIPTLREVFECVNRRVKIDIELKGPGTVEPVIALIEEYVQQRGWQYDDFIVTAFDHYKLKELLDLAPHIPVGALLEGIPLDHGAFAHNMNVPVIGASKNHIDQAYVDAIHASGMKVVVFTADDPDDIADMKALGVDGIISNYPDRLH